MRLDDLIGTWSLSSLISKSTEGVELRSFGQTPKGFLTYTATGHVSAVLMASGRPKFASDDIRGGTPEEIKQAFEEFEAYAGTFAVDEETGTVTHHVEVSRFPNWEGATLVRYAKMSGDVLELTTPLILAYGKSWIVTAEWRRTE